MFLFLGFLAMLLLWKEDSSYWQIGIALRLHRHRRWARRHARVPLADRVGPGRRAGMASGTADLQRDLGGAIMQSILGALLTAGYATAFTAAIGGSPEADQVSVRRAGRPHQVLRLRGRDRAAVPQYTDQIIAAAKTSFLDGDDWAYPAGLVAIVLGALLVFFMFPRRDEEQQLLRRYHAEDIDPPATGEPL